MRRPYKIGPDRLLELVHEHVELVVRRRPVEASFRVLDEPVERRERRVDQLPPARETGRGREGHRSREAARAYGEMGSE
jgi:hypothetical protein